MGNNICPICGYPNLDHPARDPDTKVPSFDICPSCGCEFGYHDATPHAEERYRRNWVQQGAPWFKPELKPLEWNLEDQLAQIGIDLGDFNQ